MTTTLAPSRSDRGIARSPDASLRAPTSPTDARAPLGQGDDAVDARAPVDARVQAGARRRAMAGAVQPMQAAPAAAGGGVTDVGTMRPGELERLRASPNVEDRRRAATIARAQVAYAEHMRAGGRVVVSTSAANGGHPVVTLVPPGFDPSRPARVHTHYHGFHATVADPRNHSSGTTARMEQLMRRDPQRVFVLPEAANARAGQYATDWSNVRSQAQTTRDALRAASVRDVAHRTVSAHSGGGEALRRAMQAQRDGGGVEADRLELADSLYGSEHTISAWARTDAGRRVDEVVYLHGTNSAGRDASLGRAFADRYRRVRVLGPDAHNRAVRDFLGG